MTYSDIRTNPFYYEKDPKKKDIKWANELIGVFRSHWKPIVNKKRAEEGMNMLMGDMNMDDVIASFKEGSSFVKGFGENNIVAAPVFERIRNIIIAEIKKATYSPQVNAIDPAAENERQEDITMLQNRGMLERPMTAMNRRMGMPPFKLGRENFKSNVDSFDEMGLDESNPQDLSFFRKVYQRLDHEIAATAIAQSLLTYNGFDDYIEEMVNDVLSKKALFWQQYEDRRTGELKMRYMAPETGRWIKGRSRLGKDSMCIGYETQVTVKEFLERSAGYFDFNRDRHILLLAISNGGNMTGDWYQLSYNGAINQEGDCVASWGVINTMMVNVGYIEWKSIDGSARKVNKKTGISYPLDYGQDVSANSIYYKDTSELQKTYKAHYISAGLYQQYIWDMGPLYHMMTDGTYDEFSSYSMSVWTGTGKTAMEVSKPLLKVANFALYKLIWGIYESKPNVEVYNVDTLYNLIGKLGPDGSATAGIPGGTTTGSADQLMSLISYMRKSLLRLYSVEDGQKMGGDGRPHYVEPGGIDPIAVAMQSVVDWAEAKISSQLGINALRDGYSPDPKDGLKLNMQALQQSRNATYYIPDAISSIMSMTTTGFIKLSQDCIEFGGPGKDFLTTLIGTDNVAIIKTLGQVPLHRYGMFVNVYNTEQRREELRQEAAMAFQKGEIQYYEYMLIKEISDPHKAAMTLAFFKERGDRIIQQQKDNEFKQSMQLQDKKTQDQLAIDSNKGKWGVAERAEWGKYYMAAHKTVQEAGLMKKEMDGDQGMKKEVVKGQNKLAAIQGQAVAASQKPLETAAPAGPPSASGSAQ